MSVNDLAVWAMFLTALYYLVIERWLKKARRKTKKPPRR